MGFAAGDARGGTVLRALAKDERGLSLVEILIAVTMMSIVCVALAGYFISALEKSAEESRRVIATHLARYKTVEIRELFHDPARFDDLRNALRASPTIVWTTAAPGMLAGHLDDTSINGTSYRYEVTFRDDGRDTAMVRVQVRVLWSNADPPPPSAVPAFSTFVESFVVRGR